MEQQLKYEVWKDGKLQETFTDHDSASALCKEIGGTILIDNVAEEYCNKKAEKTNESADLFEITNRLVELKNKEKENNVNSSTHDSVSHPRHYSQGNIECIDAMISAFGINDTAAFCKINAFKYLWRMDHKNNSIEDAQKAIWYLNKFIELKNNKQE